MKKVKVLAVGSGPFIKRGVESYLLNIYNFIDHNKIDIDFLTPYRCENIDFYKVTDRYHNKIIELKIKGNKYLFPITFEQKLYRFLKNNKYDVVYINTGNLLPMASAVLAAYRANIKGRIVHAHNGGKETIKSKIIKFITKPIIDKCPTNYLTCSDYASSHVFSNDKITVFIPNGIELYKYSYSEMNRNRIRKEYQLEQKIVIGHVGAFIEQKNHEFLVNAFAISYARDKNIRLVLIGEGPKLENVKGLVKKLNIEESVLFLGRIDNVDQWLSCFDLFVLPSIFEGLPVCAVEAQASGLYCLLSSNITNEVKLLEETEFIDIDDYKTWADQMCKLSKMRRKSATLTDAMTAFDIRNSANKLCNVFMESCER